MRTVDAAARVIGFVAALDARFGRSSEVGLVGFVESDLQRDRDDDGGITFVGLGDDVEALDRAGVVDARPPTIRGDDLEHVERVDEVVEEIVEAYAADPLIFRGPYERPLLETEVVALGRSRADVGALTMPVLVCHGSEDPFVDYGTSLAAVESMPSHDKTIRLHDGARHERPPKPP